MLQSGKERFDDVAAIGKLIQDRIKAPQFFNGMHDPYAVELGFILKQAYFRAGRAGINDDNFVHVHSLNWKRGSCSDVASLQPVYWKASFLCCVVVPPQFPR